MWRKGKKCNAHSSLYNQLYSFGWVADWTDGDGNHLKPRPLPLRGPQVWAAPSAAARMRAAAEGAAPCLGDRLHQIPVPSVHEIPPPCLSKKFPPST